MSTHTAFSPRSTPSAAEKHATNLTIDLTNLHPARRHAEGARICRTAGEGTFGRIITDQLDGLARAEQAERLSRWAGPLGAGR